MGGKSERGREVETGRGGWKGGGGVRKVREKEDANRCNRRRRRRTREGGREGGREGVSQDKQRAGK